MKRRIRARGQRGQVVIIMILAMMLVISVGALVIDGGLNYLDRRHLQLTADAGALAGASSLGILGSNSATNALTNGQSFVWQNLRLATPAGCLSSTPSGSATVGFTLTCSSSGFTVNVTNPLYPTGTSGATYTQDNSHASYPPEDTVGIDISHANPSSGLSRLLGFGATTITSHAVAEAQPGTRQFPFALATRYLDLTGNSSIQLYGAALIGACTADGTGNFTDHNKNGGIYTGGAGSGLALGASVDTSSGTTYYTSPEAIILADPSTASCTGSQGNADASNGWTGLQDQVSFLQSDSEYNPFWAFNAGPSGCSANNATPMACELTWAGDTPNWTDNCWKNGPDVPIVGDTPPPTYDQNPSNPSPFSPGGTPVSCSNRGNNAATYEGSYSYRDWPGFPFYSTPATIAAILNVAATPSGSLPCSGTIPANAGTGGNAYGSGSCTNPNVTFKPGLYTFTGDINIQPKSWGCDTSGPAAPPSNNLTGCVFVFSGGASLTFGNNSNLDCTAGTNFGGCSFEFSDPDTTTTNNWNVLSIGGSGTSINLAPIPYTQNTGSGLQQFKFPVLYSNGTGDKCLNGNDQILCAISISQASGSAPISGTIYVPHGVVYLNANATAATGQVIADTIRLQAGASAVNPGVAYKGSVAAPVPGTAVIVE